MTKASEGVQRQPSAESCEGKECYLSIDQTLTHSYTYKRLEDDGEDCHEPTDDEMARAVHQSQRRFERFAITYCQAGGFGDDQCDRPCKCLPTITQWRCKVTGWRKSDNRCLIDMEISGHIDCTCQME